MAEGTIDAAGEEVGPAGGERGFIAITGTMTAGGIIVLIQPSQSASFFPADYIDVSRFEQVPNAAGDGYGFVSDYNLGIGGAVKLISSAAFVGDLTAFVGIQGN
jgi:hypothetical protein